MEIKSQPESQNITYVINVPEFDQIKMGFKYYYANALRATSEEKNGDFYLGYSISDSIFSHVPVEDGIQIRLPLQREYPFLVNLTNLAIIRLRKEKRISTKMPGESRLLILLENK